MSFHGRLLRLALPLVKLRTRLRGVTLGVCAAVFDEAGRVLLVRHSYVDGWRFPGGGVEYGETVLHALARELREEVGMALAGPPELKGLFRNPEWTAGDHVAFFEGLAGRRLDWSPNLEIEAQGFFDCTALPADVHGSVTRRLAERAGGETSEIW